MRRILVLLLFAVALLPVAAAGAAPSDAPSQRLDRDQPTVTGRVVIGDGHLDIGPRLRGDSWQVAIHDDRATPVWRRPADVAIRVHDAARLTAPRSAQYGFLGDAQGRSVFVIPQTQNRGVVWTGWNTQDPNVLDAVALGATFTFRGVRGPGQLHVFLQAGTGGPPQLLWTSAKRAAQPLFVEANTHTHANWVFTEAGAYDVDFEVSAKLRSGRTVSDRQTLHFVVGDETPVPAASAAAAPTASAASGAAAASGAPAASAAPAAGTSTPAAASGGGAATWLVAGGIVVVVLVVVTLVSVQNRSRRRAAQAAITARQS